MLAKESGGSTFDLPEELLQVLPSDPFDQLDVARKITSIALSTRVSLLEAESSSLRDKLTEKDQQIADLCAQIDALETSLSETSNKLVMADQEKESLLKDNASLSNTVRKLQRDVSKLEVFRRKLMQSLQEDDESSATGGPPIIAKPTLSEDDSALISRTTSMRSQYSDSGAEDRDSDVSASRPGLPHGLLLASQTSTPRLTPPGDMQFRFLPQEACLMIGHQYQAPILDHSLVALGLMGKNSSVKSGAACRMSSLVHSWQMLKN
uniref:Uncharacterized protein n=1 Tax=Gossypium raimondii TaxID=29730 RepID=A0A0D2UVG8_GOSRA|nr:hypothetical protein B456_011G182600 [Gossypium raimondii]